MIINTMQHSLTTEQQVELGDEQIVHLRDINPTLFNRLAVAPSTKEEVRELAKDFVGFIENIAQDSTEIRAVILPVSSPSVMFSFARAIGAKENGTLPYGGWRLKFLFAHSERVCEERAQLDGTIVKVNKFIHKGFIAL